MSLLRFFLIEVFRYDEFADLDDRTIADHKRPALPAVTRKIRPLSYQHPRSVSSKLLLRIRDPKQPIVVVRDDPINGRRKIRLPFTHHRFSSLIPLSFILHPLSFICAFTSR